MKKQIAVWLIVFGLFLTGCAVQESESVSAPTDLSDGQQGTLLETEPPQPTMTKVPAITDRGTVIPSDVEGGLTAIEYPLLLKETAEEILPAFADADWNTYSPMPREVQIGEDLFSFQTEEILPQEDIGGIEVSRQEANILKNGELLMTIPLGTTGPINPVYGIYTDGSAWYFEIDRGESYMGEDGGIVIPNLGDIYRDGESLNELEGYDESFGFTLLAGRPFYLFERSGEFGYSLDGVEYSLPYTNIWHHRCCSAGMLNPRSSEDSVAIFAEKGDQLHLIVLTINE